MPAIDNRTSTIDNHAMRLLITAGPTREYIDSVRFISNASSGRMGYAIAAEAAFRGHEVVLISGPVELPAPEGVELVRVVSAQQMLDAAVKRFAGCRVAVMVAAVADFRPALDDRAVAPVGAAVPPAGTSSASVPPSTKLPKSSHPLTLRLEPTEDICARLGRIKGNRVVVGFAMEDHDHRAHAEEKLRRKACDAIILNRVETAGAADAEIEILDAATGWSSPFRGSKADVARVIVDAVERLTAGCETTREA